MNTRKENKFSHNSGFIQGFGRERRNKLLNRRPRGDLRHQRSQRLHLHETVRKKSEEMKARNPSQGARSSVHTGENRRSTILLRSPLFDAFYRVFQFDISSSPTRALDFEAEKEFVVIVTATDHGENALSAKVEVNIRVSDEQDEVPIFEQSMYDVKVNENQPDTFLIQVEQRWTCSQSILDIFAGVFPLPISQHPQTQIVPKTHRSKQRTPIRCRRSPTSSRKETDDFSTSIRRLAPFPP